MGIGEPTTYGNGVLGMEDIGSGRIVDNNGFPEVTTNLRQILHVISLVVVAALSEQTVVNHVMYIKLVKKWVAVLEKS